MIYCKFVVIVLISFLSLASSQMIPKTEEEFDQCLKTFTSAPDSILSLFYIDLMRSIHEEPVRCKFLHDLIFVKLQGLINTENCRDSHWKMAIDSTIMDFMETDKNENMVSIINDLVMPKHPFYSVIDYPLTVEILICEFGHLDSYVEEFEDRVFRRFIRGFKFKDSDVDFSLPHIKLLNFLNKFVKLGRFDGKNSKYHRAFLIAATINDFKLVHKILHIFTYSIEVNFDLAIIAENIFDKMKEIPRMQEKTLKLAGINRPLELDDYHLICDRCSNYSVLDIRNIAPEIDKYWWDELCDPSADVKKKVIRAAFDPKTDAEWVLFWINATKIKYFRHASDNTEDFYEIALSYSLIWYFNQIYPDFEGDIVDMSVTALLAELEEDEHWEGVTVRDLQKGKFFNYVPAARFFIKKTGLYSQVHEKFRNQCLLESARLGHTEVFILLLNESGITYNDEILKMCLKQAAQNGNIDVLKMLDFIEFPTLEEKVNLLEPLVRCAIGSVDVETVKVLFEVFDKHRSLKFTFQICYRGQDMARYFLSTGRLRRNIDNVKADLYRLSCENGNLTNFEYAFPFLIHDKEKLQEGFRKLTDLEIKEGRLVKFILWLNSKKDTIQLDEDLIKILYVAAIKSNKNHNLEQLISTFPWPKNLSVDEAMDLAISSKAESSIKIIKHKFGLSLIWALYVAAIKSNKIHNLDQLISTFPWPKNLSVDDTLNLASKIKAENSIKIIKHKFGLN